MQINWVDLAIIAIVILSVLTGVIRGLVKELIALAVWVLGVSIAYNYSSNLDPWLQQYIQDTVIRNIFSFVMVIIAVILVGGALNAVLNFIVKRSGLSGTDRMLGMLFGLIRGIFIVAVIIAVIRMTSLPHEHYAKESTLYARFYPLVNWINHLMPTFVKQIKVIDKFAIIDYEAEEKEKILPQ